VNFVIQLKRVKLKKRKLNSNKSYKINKIIFITIIVLTSTLCYSQDIIELKSGSKIKAKVTEISTKQMKYKKFNNINGPTYTINLDKVIMVTYENGERELFSNKESNSKKLGISKGFYSGFYLGNEKISKKKFKNILNSNTKAYEEYKSGSLNKTLGLIFTSASSAYIGWSIGKKEEVESETILIGGIGLVTGIIEIIRGNSLIKKSIKTYNNDQKISYKIKINNDGFGISLRF